MSRWSVSQWLCNQLFFLLLFLLRMNVGVAHSEVNPNTRVMNSRGIWLAYSISVATLHIILLSIPFFSVPVVWTLTNVIHNLVGQGSVTVVSRHMLQFLTPASCSPKPLSILWVCQSFKREMYFSHERKPAYCCDFLLWMLQCRICLRITTRLNPPANSLEIAFHLSSIRKHLRYLDALFSATK